MIAIFIILINWLPCKIADNMKLIKIGHHRSALPKLELFGSIWLHMGSIWFCIKWLICLKHEMTSVTDPGFPQGGGVNPPRGGVNTQFCQILPKTAWNWKNLDAEGGGVRPSRPPLDPPLDFHRPDDMLLAYNLAITPCYRLHSEASEGYVFTGICLFKSGGGG